MYFEMTEFYKRDVYFVFDEEKNKNLDTFSFENGQKLNINFPLIYNVDKLDNYINTYDLLPTFGSTTLVSNKFRSVFNDLNDTVQYLNTKIVDIKGHHNENFFLLNILNILPVMDVERSVYEFKKYGDAEILNIKKLFIKDNGLKEYI